MCCFGVFGDGEVVEFDVVVGGEWCKVWVVGYDEGDFDGKLVCFGVEEEVVEVVVDFGYYDEDFWFLCYGLDVVCYVIFVG